MKSFSTYAIDCITTANMGSCHCGDCCALVYADGSIKYIGDESWQRSEQHFPIWVEAKRFANYPIEKVDDCPNKPIFKIWRSYHSNLQYEDYCKAIRKAVHNPAAFMGSDEDWEELKKVYSNL